MLNSNTIEYKWSVWLKEPIYVLEGNKLKIQRHAAMREFVEDGIIPLLKSAGYSFSINPTEITRKILHILFVLWQGKELHVPELKLSESEFHQQYQYILTTKKWSNFWKMWGGIEDFQEDGYGYCLQIELPYFLWNWIDFESSSAIQELLDDPDDIESSGRNARGDEYQSDLYSANVKDKHLY